MLLQRERDKKYSVLKQKVQMQRQLISKKEELAEELREKANGEQMEVHVHEENGNSSPPSNINCIVE